MLLVGVRGPISQNPTAVTRYLLHFGRRGGEGGAACWEGHEESTPSLCVWRPAQGEAVKRKAYSQRAKNHEARPQDVMLA